MPQEFVLKLYKMSGGYKMKTRKHIITSRTKNFHFSVSFNPDTGVPEEFFIVGRGTVGHDLDKELHKLSIETCKIMQGEIVC